MLHKFTAFINALIPTGISVQQHAVFNGGEEEAVNLIHVAESVYVCLNSHGSFNSLGNSQRYLLRV